MTRKADIATGVALTTLGAAFSVTVLMTVPEASYGVGPRAFPFWLGVLLAVLGFLLVVTRVMGRDDRVEAGDEIPPPEATAKAWFEFRMMLIVCATIVVYGMAMQRIGFLYATVLVVAFTLIVTLKERRLGVILGMSAGIAVGAWLIFGKLLGAYMPPGSWI